VTTPPPTPERQCHPKQGRGAKGWWAWAGRIRVRLLVVNLVLVLVPVVGLEFARLYERQLLFSLERDMRNQAALLKQVLLADAERAIAFGDPQHERVLTLAARSTRTRLRILDPTFAVVADSHRNGPPEGPEPEAPTYTRAGDTSRAWLGMPIAEGPQIPLPERPELKQAQQGQRATATRLRARPPAVLLFLAEPIRRNSEVLGTIYVTRSTQPVLVEMHRIRAGLLYLMAGAVASTAFVTVLLAWTLTRPIERIARAARRIAEGHCEVKVPVGGGGELTELSVALAEMTAQLQARHRYISEFAADVAHEFKSPLTSIRGAAELLSEGAADDPVSRTRFLRNILLDAERLDQLVSRLLELSRIEASEEPLTMVPIDSIVRRAVERCESPDQPILWQGAGEHQMAWVRPRDLETALLNLLDNAMRYSPASANVVVAIRSNDDASQLGIAVTDSGPGVPKELESRIFERFFTTNPEAGGTGLGLSIVSSVARALGGRVELDSGSEKGTTFTLWIPRGQTSG
jgi:two-component system, OmpR family, sensor histidine kinase ChvG